MVDRFLKEKKKIIIYVLKIYSYYRQKGAIFASDKNCSDVVVTMPTCLSITGSEEFSCFHHRVDR